MVNPLEVAFPGLAGSGYRVTSPRDPDYNCIAWAAGETDKWWWPGSPGKRGVHWPDGAIHEATVEAFVEAFETLGYRSCGLNDALEEGFEKLAILTLNGRVKHMARQLRSGLWTSKMGALEDISHHLSALDDDPMYGKVVRILRRSRQGRRRRR